MTLEPILQTLESSGLIQLFAAHPKLEYAFRHALVQQSTYLTLVRADRRHVHQVVGEVLERTGRCVKKCVISGEPEYPGFGAPKV